MLGLGIALHYRRIRGALFPVAISALSCGIVLCAIFIQALEAGNLDIKVISRHCQAYTAFRNGCGLFPP